MTYTPETIEQLSRAVEVITAYDDDDQFACNIITAHLIEGGTQAIIDLSIGLMVIGHGLLGRLEVVEPDGVNVQQMLQNRRSRRPRRRRHHPLITDRRV